MSLHDFSMCVCVDKRVQGSGTQQTKGKSVWLLLVIICLSKFTDRAAEWRPDTSDALAEVTLGSR